MGLTKADYNKNREEVRADNSDLSLTELADKYRGVKTMEYMVRNSIKSKLSEEQTPDKLDVATEIEEYKGDNAYGVGYEEWEALIPLDDEERSLPELLAEEIGHNVDHGIRPDIELDDTEEAIYREFAAAAIRDAVLPGNIDELVSHYFKTNEALEQHYGDREDLASQIQNEIPVILENVKEAKQRAENSESRNLGIIEDYDQALFDQLSDIGLEINVNGEDRSLPNPAMRYEHSKVGYPRPGWMAGDLKGFHDPEQVVQELENDLEKTPEELAEENSQLFDNVVQEARKDAGFDQAHIVGRQLYSELKEVEGFSAEEFFRLTEDEIVELIRSKKSEIVEHYGIQSEEFQQEDVL